MEQEIELLKAKIKVLELEIEILKAKQNQGTFIVYPSYPNIEPYNPYPLNPPFVPIYPTIC